MLRQVPVGLSWGLLGLSWALLGFSWSSLGRFLASLGRVLARLAVTSSILLNFWSILGASWASFGCLFGVSGDLKTMKNHSVFVCFCYIGQSCLQLGLFTHSWSLFCFI